MDERTKILHCGHDIDPHTGASAIPIHQVSTYHQEDPVNLGHYEYGRGQNPTCEALEGTIAALEGGERGFALASGVAAIGTTLLMFQPGDHLVVTADVYGGTYRLFSSLFDRWGLKVTFVDMTDLDAVAAAITPATRALYAETPSNPTLKVTDLQAIGALANERGLLAIIDNTFMTPYLQKPFAYGFDIVLHSATKFLGGHSDLIAGLAVTKGEELGQRFKYVLNSFGAILGPQDAYLVLRGIKTLAPRMEMQQETAGKLAQWLQSRNEVVRVFYPGLIEHPGHDIHAKQSSGGGAVVSFELADGPTAQTFLKAAKLPLVAVSLGGVESILSYPPAMSHASMPPSERRERGISDGLIRFSVGLESYQDLRDDLLQAFGA